MNVLGSSTLQTLFQRYQTTELTYNDSVASALGLLPTSCLIKIMGRNYPCVVHSSSFSQGKVFLKFPDELIQDLKTGTCQVALSLVFFNENLGKNEAFQMSGQAHLIQLHKTNDGSISIYLSVLYSHRPHDSFLEKQGDYLQLQQEVRQRREERIPLEGEAAALLGLTTTHTVVTIDQIERKCLLRELSFGGARVILTGLSQYLISKPFELTLTIQEGGRLQIPGNIVRAESVEGHRELAVIGLCYSPESVPVEYLNAIRKGLKQGLGRGSDKDPQSPRPTPVKQSQTSQIDVKNLRIVPGSRHS